MQAWFCETLDGPDALTWKDAPTPDTFNTRQL